MKKLALVLAGALLPAPFFPALAAPDAPATTPTTPAAPVAPALTPNEAAGLAMLDQSIAAYAKLDGLSMKWAISISYENGRVMPDSGTLDFDKTGRARLTSTGFRPLLVVNEAQKDPKLALSRVVGKMPSTAFFPLELLMEGQNPLRSTEFGPTGIAKGIHLLPNGGVVGTAESTFNSAAGEEKQCSNEYVFYLDPTDHLLRRFEDKMLIDGKVIRTLMTFSDVRVNPQFAPDTFVSASPFQPLAPEPPRAPRVNYDPKLVVGAKPYALTGLDLGGKPVDLSAYQGKVVLLDFWATWCGPCVGELPNVLANYGKYHAKGFDIVGVSLDEDKKALTDFVAARKMPWPQLFDGKGWKNVNSTAYGVRAIPFTLLIGKDGTIAAVNPRGEELEPALKKAMAM